VPYSQEDQNKLKAFKLNQILRLQAFGTRKKRSIQQNKYIHAIFRHVVDNARDPEWSTPEKVKRNVKMAMKFFKDDVVVSGNKVWFELRSFAFNEMEAQEADKVYNEAKNICAGYLGVPPETLEAIAKEERKK